MQTTRLIGRLAPVFYCLIVGAVVAAVSAGGRFALWVGYAPTERVGQVIAWLPIALMGLRFDVSAGAVAALVLLPLAAGLTRAWVRKMFVIVAGVVVAMAVLASMAEYYFYRFYHQRFNALVFGIVEDDTRAVIANIATGFPLGRAMAATAFVVLVFVLLLRARLRRLPLAGARPAPLFTALCALALMLAARGTLAGRPLVRQELRVSDFPLDNELVPGALAMLYNAWRSHQTSLDLGRDITIGLRELGFASAQDAARVAGLKGGDDDAIANQLFAHAPATTIAERPHVVLALLESFGDDLTASDGPGNDLLGRLRPHLARNLQFRNFMASQNATHPTLEALLFASPITPLTQGRHGMAELPTSLALPFRAAGYQTEFLYGGPGTWRSIGTVMPQQGFDRFVGQSDIERRFPQATHGAWGVYDEYLFATARELIDDADRRGERLFLVLLTTSNHPSHTLPANVPPLAFDLAGLPDDRTPRDADLRAMLATYRYQADQFGGFLDGLDQSAAGSHTVVMAMGDHNLREHRSFEQPRQQASIDRVFAMLRLPAAMGHRAATFDALPWATHEDVGPTLVSLVLPGARYFASGRNLLGPRTGEGALSSYQRLYTNGGMALGMIHPVWHDWQHPFSTLQAKGRQPNEEETALVRRRAAHVALHDWFLRRSGRTPALPPR